MLGSDDPWADLLTPTPAPRPASDAGPADAGDPWADLMPKATRAPTGLLDKLRSMRGQDWGAMGVRLLSGILSNVGDVPSPVTTPMAASIGGLGETLAEKIEGRSLDPREIAVASGISALPFGRIFKGGADLVQGSGIIPAAINASGRVVRGAVKGGALGAGLTTASSLATRGELPSMDELLTGAEMNAAGGAAASAFTRAAMGGGFSSRRGPRTLTAADELWPEKLKVEPTEAPPFEAAPTRASGEPVSRYEQVTGIDSDRLRAEAWLRDLDQSALEQDAPTRYRAMREVPRTEGTGAEPPVGFAGEPLSALEQILGIDRSRLPGGSRSALERPAEAAPLPLEGTQHQPDLFTSPADPWHDLLPQTASQAPAAPAAMPAARPGAAGLSDLLRTDAERLGHANRGTTGAAPALEDLLTELQGQPPLPSSALEHAAADVPAPPLGASTLDPATIAEIQQAPAGPPIHPSIRALHAMLSPLWAEDAVRKGVNLAEPLEQFNARILTAPPRSLMGPERALRKGIDAGLTPNVSRLFNDAAGETGAIGAGPLYYLGAGAAGAGLGAASEDDNPALGAAGGGTLGMLAVAALRNPGLLNRLRYSNLLSGMAAPKKILGDLGEMVGTSIEHPERAGPMARELFAPETAAAFRRGWATPRSGGVWGPTNTVLDLPSRALEAITEAARSVHERAGATAAEADMRTFTNEPLSDSGRKGVAFARSAFGNFLLPVAKIPVNLVERGLERTPGIGALPAIRDWTGTSLRGSVGKQVRGGLSMAALAALGASLAPGGPLEDYAGPLEKFGPVMAGGAALPAAAAMMAGRKLADPASGWGETLAAAPVAFVRGMAEPSASSLLALSSFAKTNPLHALGDLLKQYFPYGGLGRTLSPVPPSEFDTGESLFAPAAAQYPLVNEALVPRKPGPQRQAR